MEIDARRGGPLEYLVRAPRRPAGEEAAPVLCFLHGRDEGAPTPLEEGATRHGPLCIEAPEGTERFLVIAPQLPRQGDLWARYADPVRDLVEREIAANHGDPRRTYLTGFSFGGNGALDLAALQPRTWAAAWAVDPTRVPVARIVQPLWISLGEASRSAARLFAHRLELRDGLSGSAGDRVHEDRGLDHVGTARVAYGEPRIYSWLLGHVRGEPAST